MRTSCRLPWVILPIVLIFMAGCSDITDDQKMLIDAGASAAKERAASFRIDRMIITAKNAADANAVNAFLDSHGNRLNGQAKGLSDLSESLKKTSKISEQMKIQILNEADTARYSMQDFIAMAPKFKPKDLGDATAVSEWIEKHSESLTKQATILSTMASKFTPKKVVAVPAPSK